jgi:hypothetical protein
VMVEETKAPVEAAARNSTRRLTGRAGDVIDATMTSVNSVS